ncbi:hypothetical protein NM688_g6731 [Phlebia brevispora]|uniref:Uncharacterized protein n=1 Tax=Phlebia brevispora TaxID=194682 RepID=A0ACC1SD89_9APHY|nr:hypothetical protein NM688_g6731 [Phlebia brevispora]
MPKIRTTRTKKPPEGYEEIEDILDDYAKKMRDAENESHEGKRKAESLWPIMRIAHARSRYIYELYYKREAISRELYDWLLNQGYADANLIAKWKKTGYEKLCCLRCIQTRDMNYQGSTCICRVPKAQVRPGTVVECVHCEDALFSEEIANSTLRTVVVFTVRSGVGYHVAQVPRTVLKLLRLSDPLSLTSSSMGILARELSEVSHILARRAQAPAQAGIFAGDNPAVYNSNDPIQLWVIQIIVVLAMTQFLALLLGRIRQPRVIAEVIGGVLLGPSVMGRIPGFTNAIFPLVSYPMLNLTSTIGLVFFLFLVGMEVDVSIMKKNARAATLISGVGLVIPLGLGAALGIAIYNQFTDHTQSFGLYLLFVAVAIGITAFPVLCRILTELKLLDDTIGVVVLAAGVGNDVVGWILLALTVALVNAQTGLTALWVLLTGVGYTLFLLLPVRWGYRWVARRTGSLENGTPSAMMMTITLVLVLFSAFFTDIIGIHPIFGGFLAGLVIPKDNGYAISLVEKLEDFIALLLLPLTNLGLLDNGITWGYTILICVVAFFSKFLGCGAMALFCGFTWRESGAIGSLMSCKGLVELIVLNVGLSAGILDTRTFSMFVLHALVLTFMTTPLTLLFYPSGFRTRAGTVSRKRNASAAAQGVEGQAVFIREAFKTRFTVILEKIEQLPAVMTLTQLLQVAGSSPPPVSSSSSDKTSSYEDEKAPDSPPGLPSHGTPQLTSVSVDALRLIELTDRTSAVLKSQSADVLARSDPVLSVFRTFGYLNRLLVSASLSVVGYEEFTSHIAEHVKETDSEMLILPWSSSTPAAHDDTAEAGSSNAITTVTPFDGLFGQRNAEARETSVVQAQFFRRMFMESPVDVGLFLDAGVPQCAGGEDQAHIFLPFFGGPDDRLALSFVVQLCMRTTTSATIVRFTKVDSDELTPVNSIEDTKGVKQTDHNQISITLPDTVYAARDTQTRLASETADNLLWEHYSTSAAPGVEDALRRIRFTHEMASKPLHSVLDTAARVFAEHTPSRPIIVVGRSRRLAVETHASELRQLLTEKGATMSSDLLKTLGDLGAAFVAANANAGLLILQAAP